MGIPSIAPSGAVFYTGALFPDWKGNLFVGALAGQALHRLVLDGDNEWWGRPPCSPTWARASATSVKDADGALWLLTDETQGRVLRVVPR